MKTFWRTLIATGMAGAALLFTLSLRAEGGGGGSALYSAFVPVGGGSNDFLRCSAVNVGTTIISHARIALISTAGIPVSGVCRDLAPNDECAVVDSSQVGGHCQILTSNGTIRAVIQLLDDQGNFKIILPLS